MSKKRYVLNPGPIAVLAPNGTPATTENGEPFGMTLSRYVREFVVNDSRFGASRTASHRASDLADEFRDEKSVYEADEADWKILSEACDEPKRDAPFTTNFYRQMRPFNDAICDAKNEAPKAKAESPALANVAAIAEA